MKQKDFAIILAPVFLLTVLWVIFEVYQSYTESTITDPLTIQIVPIDGTFNEKAIDKLKNRDRIEPLYDLQIKEALAQQSTNNATENQTILDQIPGGEVASESSQTSDQTNITQEPTPGEQ